MLTAALDDSSELVMTEDSSEPRIWNPPPWKEGNNRNYMIHPLNSLSWRFKKKPGYQEEYLQVIQKYLDMEYASRGNDEDVGGENEFYFSQNSSRTRIS